MRFLRLENEVHENLIFQRIEKPESKIHKLVALAGKSLMCSSGKSKLLSRI